MLISLRVSLLSIVVMQFAENMPWFQSFVAVSFLLFLDIPAQAFIQERVIKPPYQHSMQPLSSVLLPTAPLHSHSKKNEREVLADLPKVADMVDVSFIQACLQLSAGYVDVLKMFIATLYSAYTQGYAPATVISAIDAIAHPASGRPLAAEEIQLRNTWIQATYCVLQSEVPDQLDSIVLETTLHDTYQSLVPILKRQRTLTSEFNGKDLLKSTRSCFPDLTSPVDEAIALQTLRVMWVTWTVLEEIERCQGEFSKMDAPMPPPPKIPGAFQ